MLLETSGVLSKKTKHTIRVIVCFKVKRGAAGYFLSQIDMNQRALEAEYGHSASLVRIVRQAREFRQLEGIGDKGSRFAIWVKESCKDRLA